MKTKLQTQLVKMLTENTGRAMLDSGGESGRNWQANQHKTFKHFKAEKPVSVRFDIYEREGKLTGCPLVTISLFHFLNKVLTNYEDDLTKSFYTFSNSSEHEDEDWHECVENWLFWREDAGPGEYTDKWINSYNSECDLSQIILFRPFSIERNEYQFTKPGTIKQYIALQIHGGCDVRGGYTKPAIFEIPYLEDVDGANIDDVATYTLTDGENNWDFRHGQFECASAWNNEKTPSDFKSFPYTTDRKLKGKGFIYVDKKGNGYSPLNGKKITAYQF